MKKILLVFLFTVNFIYSQVGIGTTTPESTSLLDVTSTSKGVLVPRMTATQKGNISSPATGLLIYQTDGTAGFYYYSGSAWNLLASAVVSIANGGTGSSTKNFMDLSTAQTISGVKTFSNNLVIDNLYIGRRSSINDESIAFGKDALSTVSSNYMGSSTALGYYALKSSTDDGALNTAVGNYSLYANTTGSRNTALGKNSLIANTTGNDNVAIGESALRWITTGSENIAIGSSSSSSTFNTTGNQNIMIGSGTQIQGNYNNSIAIGTNAIVSASNTVRIGNSSSSNYGIYGSWSNVSDKKMKHDIVDLPTGLDFIKKLRPVEFVYNNSDKEEKSYGFIAQEVKMAVEKTKMQKSGLVQNMDSTYLSIKITELIPFLTKAIQEQQEIISELKDEVKKLKSKSEKDYSLKE